jgi:glycosyltransferase involved in cell wall biosynthesis
MVRGGAERTVLDTSRALRKLGGVTQTAYLLHKSQLQYPIEEAENANFVFVDGDKDGMRSIALKVLQSPVPVLYTHLLRSQYLRHLWSMGVVTIPVVQNSRPSWLDAPTAYNHPRVPFVVAVSDAVADQLRESGCEKPVVTIRHEVQRWFKPEELVRNRKEVRDRHGIRDNTLLIGMVGQFKAQKAYTRAVRVLHSIRQLYQAKLMILGGWDHEFGSGRTAYEAACRQAVDLGVIADMITPGDVHPVEPYLAAFDVFLNTSVYEGLSVSLLEAIQMGCPIC